MNLVGEKETKKKAEKVTFVVQMCHRGSATSPTGRDGRKTNERSASTQSPTRLSSFHHNRSVVCLPHISLPLPSPVSLPSCRMTKKTLSQPSKEIKNPST